eukprot:jgi/Ulvmu1/8064/UM004_0301.1
MNHLAVLSWLLATATTCASSPGRSLQQQISPFWSKERRITNETAEYNTDIVPHSAETISAAAFGGCEGPLCPTVPDLVAYRLCFASRDATVRLTTIPGRRSKYFDTQLYVFALEGDAPPTREDKVTADLWDPPYSQFFASPTVVEQHFDDNSAAMCSSAANVTFDVCTTPGAGCVPEPFGIQCPPGTLPRLLSQVEFQIAHGFGRPYKCMYAVIGAKDAPPGTESLDIGLLIETSMPRLLPGSSPGNPRIGPFNLLDLGIGAVPPATSAEPLVEPAWLSLSQAVAVGCDSDSCLADADFGEESTAPMFVYTNLCLEQSNEANQTARVRTRYGGSGPSDTTLFVYDEARAVSEWNDAGADICSDGTQPSKDNCGADRICQSPDDRCAGEDVQLYSLSQVDVPVAQGTGSTCFNAGIGARQDSGDVLNAGVDVILLSPDGAEKLAISITTEVLENGTIATTTTTTYPNGTSTSTVRLVDPAALAPAPAAVAPAAEGPSSTSAAVVGAADEILGGPPLPPPASPDSPVHAYSSAVDMITGGMFRARRRRALLAAADATPSLPAAGSREAPRTGPFSLRDLAVPPLAIGATAAVAPVWLDVQPPAHADCEACVAAALPDVARVFVYHDICFQRPPYGELTASVATIHSVEGPKRVRLQLMTNGGLLPADSTQHTLRRRCTGGGRLSTAECAAGACYTLDDMCAGGERAVTEAEVSTGVSSGEGVECFSVAVTVSDAQQGPALVGLKLSARSLR